MSKPVQIQLSGKKPPGKHGAPANNIVVNAFPMTFSKNIPIFKYDLRILAYFERAKAPKEICKQCYDDFSEVQRKQLQAEIMDQLVARERSFFVKGANSFVTDRAACMYSLDKLDIEDAENGKVFEFDHGEIQRFESIKNADKVTVKITPVSESFQGSTNVLDNFFREFANVAVAHEPYKHNELFIVQKNSILVVDPEGAGFNREDAPDLPGAAKALPELKKSVKVVEGPAYKPGAPSKAVFVLDVSKSPIHLDQPLAKKIESVYMECGGRRAPRNFNMGQAIQSKPVLNAVKHLEVVPTHRPNARSFGVRGFGGAARQEVIPDLNKTVEHYFRDVLKFTLKHPEWPCVRDPRGSLFPLEVLKVCPFQRVRKGQEFPEQTERVTQAAATLPVKRKTQIVTGLESLGLENDTFLHLAGMLVAADMITLRSARNINPPRIIYAQGQGENVQFGKWRLNRNRYFKPATAVQKWSVWANVEDRNLEVVGAFVDQVKSRAMARGLILGAPSKIHISSDQLGDHMKEASKNGTQFVMVISEDYEECHKELKYLEIKYNIPTQEVTMRVARNAVTKNQGVTFDNIILKTNIKNKGLNHDINYQQPQLQHLVSSTERMIIGIEMSHSSTGERDRSASVIGWSANCLGHPTQYTGNFMYVRPRETEPDLTPVFKQVLGRLQKYRKQPPKFIDIFMGGVSEGQLARVAKSSVTSLLSVCAILKFQPIVSLIAVSQDHVERFFLQNPNPNGNCGQQNVQPGLVVDREIVSPSRSEFFLVACTPLQGTIKVPKYTVCVDTSGQRSMDEIQMQAYGLSHLHQYNTATTSIPTPLYCARDYAQRGADVLPFIAKNDLPDGVWDLDALNQVTYQRTPLDDARMA